MGSDVIRGEGEEEGVIGRKEGKGELGITYFVKTFNVVFNVCRWVSWRFI